MFKIIRKLIKITIILILTSPIWFPILVIAMAYKEYSPPIDTYYMQHSSAVSFNDKVEDALNNFIVNKDQISLGLSQDETNIAVIEGFKEANPNYLSQDPNVSENDRIYAQKFGDVGGFKGVTVFYEQDKVALEAGLKLSLFGIEYPTSIFLKFDVTVNEGIYRLKLDEVSLGNMPVLWMYDLADFMVGLVHEGGISKIIADVMPFGTFDGKDKSLTVTGVELAQVINPNPEDPNGVMLEALLGFINEADLLDANIDNDSADISLNLASMLYTKGGYTILNPLTNDQDVEELFENQIISMMISSISSDPNKLHFDLNELSFNRLLDYYMRDYMDFEQVISFGQTDFTLKIKPLFAKFNNQNVEFTIIMELSSSTVSETFETAFTLVSQPEVLGNDLIFNVSSIILGDDLALSDENIELIFNLLGSDNEYIEDNKIILKDFAENFTQAGFDVESVSVLSTNTLRFVVTTTNQQLLTVLGQLSAVIDSVIDDVFNQQLTDPVYDNATNQANDLLNGSGSASELIDAINQLPDNNQNEVYQALYTTITQEGIDLDSILP